MIICFNPFFISMSPTTAPGSLPLINLSDMNDSPSMFGASSNSSLVDFTPSPRMGSPIRAEAEEVSHYMYYLH